MTPIEHGTLSGYNYHRCRCQECRLNYSDYMLARRKRLREEPLPAYAPHGSYTTYVNYGCRCDECRAAVRVRARAYRARKAAQ